MADVPDLAQAKSAVAAAAEYYKGLVPKIRPNKLRLEEIEYTAVNNEFKITLSYPQDDTDGIFASDKRDLKIFIVDSNDSTVKSMKIREV